MAQRAKEEGGGLAMIHEIVKEETKGDFDGASSHSSFVSIKDDQEYNPKDSDTDLGNFEHSKSSHSEESLERR